MPNVEKISIALPPEMAALMRQVVEAGEYASNSEVIRDALRDWTYKRELRLRGLEDLRAVWDEAIHDSRARVPAEDVLKRLRSKYRALVETGAK